MAFEHSPYNDDDMKKQQVPKNENPTPPPPKKQNEIIVKYFFGAPDTVEYEIQSFYNANPTIEVLSREMSATHDARQECMMVTYFITYKKASHLTIQKI